MKKREKEKKKDVAFTAMSNNELVCKDCKYRDKPEYLVASCEIFPDMKPIEVLFEGKDCPEYEKE